MQTILPSQPESYRQLLKRSLILYRKSFLSVLLLSTLFALVIFIPRILSFIVSQDIFYNLPPFSPYYLFLMVINLGGLLFFIAITWRMHCVIRHKHEPFMEDFSVGLKKLGYVFFAALAQALILFGVAAVIYSMQILLEQHGLLFGSFPYGILFTTSIVLLQIALLFYAATLFILFIPLITIENKGIISALRKSARLTWNHWWRVFSLQYTPWLIYLILLIVLRIVFKLNIHFYFMEPHVQTIPATIINLIVLILFTPWIAALLLIQLKDLELREQTPYRNE